MLALEGAEAPSLWEALEGVEAPLEALEEAGALEEEGPSPPSPLQRLQQQLQQRLPSRGLAALQTWLLL